MRRNKKRLKRGSDAADEDDDDEEEEDDSERMTPRLAKRERRESESVTLGGFSNYSPTQTFPESSRRGGQTPEFKSTEGSPNMRANQAATEYGSPTMSPRIPTPQTPSVFGFERKPFDFMAPHCSSENPGLSFGYNSGSSASAKSPGYQRPVEAGGRHLLHHHQQTSHQPVYSPGQASGSGSQYSENKFHYPSDRSQPPTRHYHSAPGHAAAHVAAHRRPSVIMRAGKEDSSKLQLQADILKFHGNILTHTGNNSCKS